MTERSFFDPTSGNEIQPPAGLVFRSSTYSGPNGGQCVEVASSPERVAVRDSKDIEQPYVYASPEAFTAFTGGLAVAEFVGFDN